MIDWLVELDKAVLIFFNKTCSNPGLDTFFLMITNMHREPLTRWVGFPLIIGLIIYTSKKFWWSRVSMIIIALTLSDAISHRLIKPFFTRVRPIYDHALFGHIRIVGEAQGYSFPSNHATNMFLCATLLTLFYRTKYWLFYSIAALIALSRVYLGVHYPSDVLGGALFGTFLALLVSHFWPWPWREKLEKL